MLTDEEIKNLCISLMNKYDIFDDQANWGDGRKVYEDELFEFIKYELQGKE